MATQNVALISLLQWCCLGNRLYNYFLYSMLSWLQLMIRIVATTCQCSCVIPGYPVNLKAILFYCQQPPPNSENYTSYFYHAIDTCTCG